MYSKGCVLALVIFATSLLTSTLGTEEEVATYSVDVVYGVVIDAGSSGSRVRVYWWNDPSSQYHVPKITEKYNFKITPGISAYAKNLNGLDEHITTLVEKAKEYVPKEKQPESSIYLMATAGMRLLLEKNANNVADHIDKIFQNKTITPFAYKTSNSRILSGEEEGVFAWISVNYLRGFFNMDNVGDIKSAGILEMGGASTQITFMPKGSILADKFPVKVGGTIYPLYAHSYLYYGQNYASIWVMEYLHIQSGKATEIDNPCMVRGDVVTREVHKVNVTFTGIGNPEKCEELVHAYVYESEPYRCYPKPCALGTVYQPSIDPDSEFYAVSAFKYTVDAMDVLDEQNKFTPQALNQAANIYCSKTKDAIVAEQKTVKAKYASKYCLMGKYIPLLLTKGYGFDENTDKITLIEKINGQPTEWTLGALIYENSRGTWSRACENLTSAGTTFAPTSPTVISVFLLSVGLTQLFAFLS